MIDAASEAISPVARSGDAPSNAAEGRAPGSLRPVIVDFGVGRFVGGHNADYLAALQRAIEDIQPITVAPFLNGARTGRVRCYVLQLRTFLWTLGRRNGPRTVVISHSPEFRDIVVYWLASKLSRPSDTVGVFLFRRQADGIVGRDNWRARLIERIVPGLIRSGRIYPVSDSRSALAHWTAGLGISGSLIAIPAPLGSSGTYSRPTGGPVVGLVGRLAIEKGARAYDGIIRETLRSDETATIRVQVSDDQGGELAEITRGLQRDWADEPRVDLVNGHLTPEAYADLIGSTDVVVFPYDPASYSTGTSGVMSDTLALGRVALATQIESAAEAYAGRDDVVWLQGMDDASIASGLQAAFLRSKARRAEAEDHPRIDTFADDWLDAIRAAADMDGPRRRHKEPRIGGEVG
jgi:hypothetical protein